MPLTRFKLSAIEDGGIATADLADGAVTTAKIADSAVTSVKTSNLFTNTEIAGTEAARMPVGTTAQRANEQSGDIRFNSTLSLMEYYDGTLWKAIDSPPTISSISPSTFTSAGDTITVAGTNFQTGVNVTVIGSDGTTYTPDSVTRVSSSEVTFDITSAIFNGGLDAFDVTVSNTSGLSVTSNDALTIPNPTAAFNESATQTIYDSNRGNTFDGGVTLTGDVSESDVTLTYSLSAGTLPAGASLNTSTGAITGFSAVGSDTVSNFTINANVSDVSEGTSVDVTRAFALTIAAPVITSYTSSSGSFSVPSGVSAVDVLVVGGGGSGRTGDNGSGGGAGGGAGGLIYRPAFPVTPGGSVSYSVGSGAAAPGTGLPGQNSTFGTLTAIGGGGGSNASTGGAPSDSHGGSGGGGFRESEAGTGTQPSQPGDSGSYGFGNPGGPNTPGAGNNVGNQSGGAGGGGAGSRGYGGGDPANPNGAWAHGGYGGIGKNYDISGSTVGYAGGGGGGADYPNNPGAPSVGFGGGRGGNSPQGTASTAGQANRGGGGGGAGAYAPSGPNSDVGAAGGSGVVIIKY